jgi:hypothetical protein
MVDESTMKGSNDMTTQTPESFKIADQKIANLLKRLDDKRVCPCCTARALAFHAAFMAEQGMGSAEAIKMFEEIVADLREDKRPGADPAPSVAAH